MNNSNFNSYDSLREIQDTLQQGFIDTIDIEKELAFWSQASVQIESQASPDPNFNQEVKISNPFVFNAKKTSLKNDHLSTSKSTASSQILNEHNADYIVNRLLGLSSQYEQATSEKIYSNKHSFNYSKHIPEPQQQYSANKQDNDKEQYVQRFTQILESFLHTRSKAQEVVPQNTPATPADNSKLKMLEYLQAIMENKKNSSQPKTPINSLINNISNQNIHFDPISLELLSNNYQNTTSHQEISIPSLAQSSSSIIDQNRAPTSVSNNNIFLPQHKDIESSINIQSFNEPISHKSQPIMSSVVTYNNDDSLDSALSKKKRSPSEEDKRKRNTAASARFRVKKKMKEKDLEKKNAGMEQEINELKKKLDEVNLENKWLKNIITEKGPNEYFKTGCPCHHPNGYLEHNNCN
ncbi:hypothetical protein BB561_003329 [Smittium simulii]|uniref:BZIP domain-containing protein n=1 Tax=Smittium simulii TaxID=133385 RepID=A0A2T9YLY1_9FUNG|nr:hypothetical protein BB561_003329 [Smittium simulii]